jgi:hypothetical protein
MTTQEDVDEIRKALWGEVEYIPRKALSRIEARLRAAEGIVEASKAFLSHFAGPEWNGEIIEYLHDEINEWEKLR